MSMNLSWGAAEHDVFALRFEERLEGDVVTPVFDVEIPNPGVGGLLTGMAREATVSEDGVDIARGRLLAAPVDLGGKTVVLEFRCVPADEDEVIRSAADALRSGEDVADDAYDPLFVDTEDDDPSTALAGRPEVWRWDRLTNGIERIHLTDGDLIDLGSEGLEGSLSVRVTNPPRKRTKMRVIAGWTQRAAGTAWPKTASIRTYTPNEIISGFPSPGGGIGDATGWTFADASVDSAYADAFTDSFKVGSTKYGAASGGEVVCLPTIVNVSWTAAYDYKQQREEVLDITLDADVQDILGSDKSETAEIVRLAALNIDVATPHWRYEDPDTLEPQEYVEGDEVQAFGRAWRCLVDHVVEGTRFRSQIPASGTEAWPETEIQLWERIPSRSAMSDMRSPRFFDTERGRRAVRHALRRLKRHVVQQSMCVEVSFEVAWSLGRDITTANRIRIVNSRLPGGAVVGKVSGIELTIRGSQRLARITMLCSVGKSTLSDVGPGIPEAEYALSASYPIQPVDAYTLGNHGDWHAENTVQEQWSAASSIFNDDPVAAIGGLPTRLVIKGYPPLREEDLLRRRMSISTESVPIPGGITL